MDPYVLNDKVESVWNYYKDRLHLLGQLATKDQVENAKNEKDREIEAQ